MRVLVIGGTGFNGRRIVRRLLDHGHDVSVVTRGELPPAWNARVAQIRLDRKDSTAFAAAQMERIRTACTAVVTTSSPSSSRVWPR